MKQPRLGSEGGTAGRQRTREGPSDDSAGFSGRRPQEQRTAIQKGSGGSARGPARTPSANGAAEGRGGSGSFKRRKLGPADSDDGPAAREHPPRSRSAPGAFRRGQPRQPGDDDLARALARAGPPPRSSRRGQDEEDDDDELGSSDPSSDSGPEEEANGRSSRGRPTDGAEARGVAVKRRPVAPPDDEDDEDEDSSDDDASEDSGNEGLDDERTLEQQVSGAAPRS
jgi:hypothetical protein